MIVMESIWHSENEYLKRMKKKWKRLNRQLQLVYNIRKRMKNKLLMRGKSLKILKFDEMIEVPK